MFCNILTNVSQKQLSIIVFVQFQIILYLWFFNNSKGCFKHEENAGLFRYESNDNDEINDILNNTIYKRFQITPVKIRKQVNLLLIVSSGPHRGDRREAIRQTWWKLCQNSSKVSAECFFMTDKRNIGDPYYNEIKKEDETYNDIKYQNLKGGINFGIRFLYHLVHAYINYKFDYFMRLDDDYFVCLDEILNELPIPMHPMMHWGYVHRENKIKRPDESIIILSNDLVQLFLYQDFNKIKCHPIADQMIAVWVNELNLQKIYRHDLRLHHEPIVPKQPSLRYIGNVCSRYIGIHGSYPNDMRILWNNKKMKSDKISRGNLITNSYIVDSSEGFHWNMFSKRWQYEPKLCLDNPTWDVHMLTDVNGAYAGRQEEDDK